MSDKISRRSFLKAGLITAGAVAAAGAPGAKASAAPSQELATLLDIRKCIGCGACVEACREVNQAKFPRPKKPFPKMYPARVQVADWSDKQGVTDRLTPYNWVMIQRAEVKYQGKDYDLTLPRRCMHCQNPPCVNLCPWGAAYKQDNGIVRIDPDICLGGAKCRNVCPWFIPNRQTGVGLYLDLLPSLAGNGVMYKCDRCYQRVAKGEVPACLEVCPQQVQKIGPREEMVKEAHALAKSMNGFIYGETENGGTNTIYVSPVPFDLLAKAVEKGPGKPHLNPVKPAMDQVNNLTWAYILAPIAGAAGAVARFASLGRKKADPDQPPQAEKSKESDNERA